jgi:hypothetical protein
MISEREIWLAAKVMIDRYGKLAAIEAAERADEALEKGDPEGSAVWQRIMTAIEKLQAEKPEQEGDGAVAGNDGLPAISHFIDVLVVRGYCRRRPIFDPFPCEGTDRR